MFDRRRTLSLLCLISVWIHMGIATQARAGKSAGEQEERTSVWAGFDSSGHLRVDLYFFWTNGCPHCAKARPFVESLAERSPWLNLHSLPLSGHSQNVALYLAIADVVGEEPGGVPAFFFCGVALVGYDNDATTGAYLESVLNDCRTHLLDNQQLSPLPVAQGPERATVRVPLLGEIDTRALSLPVLTLVLAGLDSFNPCAFFVLLFLLSLLVHPRSRMRLLAIGGTFILISGLVYFLFMAAWLNLFLVFGQMQWITMIAGLLAVMIAMLNIKDYFWFQRGLSLSIPNNAKPRLYERVRNLVRADSLFSVLFGTVVLAVAANSYELLCTAGFPMIYTRALTLQELSAGSYYGYLVFYNLIYVTPLFGIVLLFVYSLGSRKLTEREGQILKLLSGTMMLGLGVLLIYSPERLNNVMTAVALVLVAISVTFLVVKVPRYLERNERGL